MLKNFALTALFPLVSCTTSTEFDPNLLESLLLPSRLDLFDDDLQNRLYGGDTASLNDLIGLTRNYLDTIPLTRDLLNDLSPEQSNEEENCWNEDQIQRVVHWIYIFETFSGWAKEQTDSTLIDWIEYNDAHLESLCSSVLIPSTETNEFEQSLGAPKSTCLKTILSDFHFMKYVGVREAYKKMLTSNGLAFDGSVELTKNIYEVVFEDYESNDRKANAMLGDRLVVMYRGLPIFAGRNCNSQKCGKSTDDEAICLNSFNQDPQHVERNCTLSQEYVDRYTEWDMNFVLGGTLNLQDTLIAKLIFPGLVKDPASYLFERVQSLYLTTISGNTRILLSPWKTRHYFDFEKVNKHAEDVLDTWMMNDPNLTSWNQTDDSPPSNGVNPEDDPLIAKVGDWMSYFNDLYPPGDNSYLVYSFISFIRTRLLFGIFVSPDAV